jgi:multimeric flavodoxin WrbA
MAIQWTRRTLIGVAGASPILWGQTTQSGAAPTTRPLKIIGVACSPRRDRTTAAALRACLDSAKGFGPHVEVELVDLGGMKIPGDVAAGVPLAPGERDDFPALGAKLRAPEVGGIIIGSPVYFSNMSALCKAFLDRWMEFRSTFALRNKVGGAIAVGAARNGGQELTLQTIHAALLCQDMIIVSEGGPTSRLGGMLVSAKDDIRGDEAGLATARSLGRRVAEVASALRAGGLSS